MDLRSSNLRLVTPAGELSAWQMRAVKRLQYHAQLRVLPQAHLECMAVQRMQKHTGTETVCEHLPVLRSENYIPEERVLGSPA